MIHQILDKSVLRIFLSFLLVFCCFFSNAQLSSSESDQLRIELSEWINNLRISKGLKPLIFNDTLKKAAQFHSDYMAKNDELTHDEKTAKYATPKDRVEAFGGKNFELVGENALYSYPQEFPLSKKEISTLAEQMFNSWKNSPGHYANMTEPEYVFADLAFQVEPTKKIVFATHVFGTKGFVVQNQLSNNTFGLHDAMDKCDHLFGNYLNIIMHMGNAIRMEENEVVLYYHNLKKFKEMFSGPGDGIAIDLVRREQLACGKQNELDFSPIFDGILLAPIYSNEMIKNNRAESEYRIITKVADIPDHLKGEEFSPSMVLIKNGNACKYLFPAYVPSAAYELRPIEPKIKDQNSIQMEREGIGKSQIIEYDFLSGKVIPLNNPSIKPQNEKVHSVVIKCFSSVEGDSVNNTKLHNARAKFIQNSIESKLQISPDKIHVDTKENWNQMNFQLHYFGREDLINISHDSLKALLKSKDQSLPWDSLLFAQRKAIAIINYSSTYDESQADQSIEEFNLRTAVAMNRPDLANKALYLMNIDHFYDPLLLFEPQIIDFIKQNPSTVANYSALLSFDYEFDPYKVTDFIHYYLNNQKPLDNESKANLLHLYSLVGTYLLENWDTSAERLSNVIHPLKVDKMTLPEKPQELLLNLQLTYIQYFGQVNDGENISKCFDFIADHFQKIALKPEDDVDLALFFNSWSMNQMTVDHLLSRFKQNKLNEEGLFILAQTMHLIHFKDETGVFVEVNKKALEANKIRWCEWINSDFQVKRNIAIKRMFCESCK